MQKQSLFRRTINLASANAVVRGLGFVQRIMMARLLGVEGLGLYQLIMPTLSMASTLVVSGLPAAASRRMAAQRGCGQLPDATGNAAMRLAVSIAVCLCAGLVVGALPIASGWFGQPDAAWGVAVYAPAVVFQAAAAVGNAWCYAHGDTGTPAMALLIEQVTRLALLAVVLLVGLPDIPSARVCLFIGCLTLAEGLALVAQWARIARRHPRSRQLRRAGETKRLAAEAAPPTAGRFVASGLQAVLSALVPRRLMAVGMSRVGAIGALGSLSGIVMPMLMLPMIVSSAMGTVLIPELARLQAQSKRQRLVGLCKKALIISAGTAAAAGLVLYVVAGPACSLFGRPQDAGLLRLCTPLLVPMAFHHTTNALLQGLGRQNQALCGVLVGDALQLITAVAVTGNTALPVGGMLAGMAVGEIVSFALQGAMLWRYTRPHTYRLSLPARADCTV